jgi:outer membrane receptor protein involved in Fe transport
MSSRADRGVAGEVDAGSRGSLDSSARIGASAGAGLLTLFGSAGRSDGFIPITRDTRGRADQPAPYRQWTARARWVAPLAPATEVQASLAAFHDQRTRGTDFSEDRTNGADASLRLVGRGDWQWSATGYWQWRNLESSTASLDPSRTTATRVLLQDSVPSYGIGGSIEVRPPMPDGIEVRVGADTRKTSGETRELANYVAGNPTRRRKAGGESWTAGGFAEASAEIRGVTVSGGARLDHWQLGSGHLFEQAIATGAVLRADHYPERHGWLPTARGGVNVPVGAGISLRSAAYFGWRMPTLNELFRPFRAGADATAANPGLDPERLGGAEAGAQYAAGAWRFSLTGFVNRLSDAIANVTLGVGPGTFPQVGFVAAGGAFRQRQNVDAVKVHGIEASGEWASGPWAVRAGASFSHARVEASGPAALLDGLRPAQTPKFAATLSGSWQQGGKSAEIVLSRIGAQYEDDLNTRVLKSATTLDASASLPIAHHLELVARAENITNALVMAALNSDGSIERATPRTLWIGLRLR